MVTVLKLLGPYWIFVRITQVSSGKALRTVPHPERPLQLMLLLAKFILTFLEVPRGCNKFLIEKKKSRLVWNPCPSCNFVDQISLPGCTAWVSVVQWHMIFILWNLGYFQYHMTNRMVVSVSVVYPRRQGQLADWELWSLPTPSITEEDSTTRPQPRSRSKHTIWSMVSTECVSLSHHHNVEKS